MASKKFLTLAQTSAYTGLSISYLRKMTAQGKIAHSKPTGKIIFIRLDDLSKFLSKNRKDAVK